MSSIRITVGAQADASFSRVFAPLLAASAAARAKVTADANAMAATQRRAAKQGADAQEREAKRVANAAARSYQSIEAMSAKAASKEAADAHRAAQAKVAAQKREFDARLKAAQKARADETRAADKAAKDIARLAAQAERESQARARREAASAARLEQQKTRAQMREFDSRARESKRAKEREERDIIRTARRAEAAEQRQFERSKANALRARTERFKDIAQGSMENMQFIGRKALGLGASAARGLGIDFSVEGMVANFAQLQKAAVDLVNSADNPANPGNVRRDPKKLMALASDVGNRNAYGATDVIAGMQSFVAKTGDIGAIEGSIGGLAEISRATNTELQDMLSAAAEISIALGDIPDKGKKIVEVIRAAAGQGKVGSVEFSDMAQHVAKVVAAASAFGGDRQKNIEFATGLMQLSKAKGGSSSPAEAANSIAGLVNTLKTPARVKAFAAEGIDIFDQQSGQIRNLQSIMEESLMKAGHDPVRFKKMFANVIGARAMEGSAITYRDARAKALASGMSEGDASNEGLRAVREELAKFNTAMTDKEVKTAHGAAMDTAAAKAQVFQNKLNELGMKLAETLLPALEKLAPKILEVAEAFTKLVSWGSENPKSAIAATVAASVGASVVKTAVGGAAAGALSGAMGAGAGKLGAGALAGAAGGAGLLGAGALALGGLGLAGWQGYELYKNARVEGSGDTFWKELKHDLGFMSDKDYENSFGIRTGAAAMSPPPTAPQPAGAPPVVTAPPPNPIPKLDEVVATGKQTVAAINDLAKTMASQGASGPSVNAAGRTGPAKK